MTPVFVVARPLMRREFTKELREQFGFRFDGLDELNREILSVVYRYGQYSSKPEVSAKMASFELWSRRGRPEDIRKFDTFYRQVRYAFNKLEKAGLLLRAPRARGFVLNSDGGRGILKPIDPSD